MAVRHCLERALGDTASTVIADVLVDLQHAVDHLRRADRAVVLYLANLAAAAEIRVKLRDALADDAQIVEVWFDTVVRASADRNLKLVRQLDALVALVEALVNLLGQIEAVEQAVLAGGSLAGHNRTNLRAGAAGLQTRLRYKGAQVVDLIVWNAADLDGQSGGHLDLAAAEQTGSLGDALALLRGDLAVAGDDARVEAVGSLVVQEAPRLDPLDVLGADGDLALLLWHLVDGQAALQHLGVGVAEVAQAVLQQVGALALVADQQQLFFLAQALDLAVDGGEIDVRRAGNLRQQGSVDDAVVRRLALHKFDWGEGIHPAVHFVFEHIDGGDKRVNRGRERRRIGHVHVLQLVDGGAHGQRDDADVGHLVDRTAAQYLYTQQLAGSLVRNQLDDECAGTRIVVRLVVDNRDGRNDVVASLARGLLV